MCVEYFANITGQSVLNGQIVKPIYIWPRKKKGPCKSTDNNQVNKHNELECISLRHIATQWTPVDIRNT